MAFDPAEYIKQQNEKEAANRVGNTTDTAVRNTANTANTAKSEDAVIPANTAVAVADPEDPEEKQEKEHAKLPRSARRELNRLREELGRTKGMLEAFEKMGKAPAVEGKTETPAPDPEAKPQRADFPDEASYLEAIAAHAGRLEAAKSEQQRQWQDRLREMHAKAQEDIKLIPDYAEHAKAAEGDGPNAVEFTPAEHPTLMALIGTSEYQALAWDYFATHPDEFEEMLTLTTKTDSKGNATEQVAEFRALEGHLKRVYRTLKVKPADKKEEAEPAKPVKLPKPSESVATHGGSAPVGEPKPYLADGKTINPAWVTRRNERDGARR